MATTYIQLPAYGDVHFAAPVATVVALPTTDPVNTVRLVTATYILYYWDGSAWAPVNSGAPGTFASIVLTDNTNQMTLGTGANKTTVTMAALTGNRTFTYPDGNSNPVRPDTGASNQFLTGIAATGIISKAQPVIADVSGLQGALDAKEPTISAGSAGTYWTGSKSFAALNVEAISAIVDGSSSGDGEINELLTATQGSVTATGVAATGTYGAATSVSVTAGRWLAWGIVQFNENGSALTAGLQAGISSSATGVGISVLETVLLNGLISSTSDAIAQVPARVISLSGTATFYLNTKFTYDSGSPRHAGTLNFLRIG